MSKESIFIYQENGHLIIDIRSVSPGQNATAVIINNTGEVIEELKLHNGHNTIDTNLYINKNYAIRVINDKNILVQKI